ncbi:MAG: 2-C-methyl-D-erythritol 4-phosphate cytidylyltransferase [Candidatus Marinimicrobia bacterium]|nr:2-C-methyl-D-erythritol 4-phosphate cytidylyltransferase [Candidatus Neomarinimicrobiota bacterium]
MRALGPESNIVAVHDAARPLFDPGIFSKAYPLLEIHDGVIAALPAAYTMKKVRGIIVEKTLAREELWQANTPQIFHRRFLEDAYRKAAETGFYGTDDAMLVEALGGSVAVIPDTPHNIKITTMSDLFTAEQILLHEEEG